MGVKKIKNTVPLLTILGATLVLLLGLLILFLPGKTVEMLFVILVSLVLFIYGIVRLIQSFGRKKKREGFIALIITWGAAAAMVAADVGLNVMAAVPSVAVAVISLLLGVFRIAICFNCIFNHIKGGLRNGISALLCLLFGIALLIYPIASFDLLSIVAGIYLMAFSVTMYCDAAAEIRRSDLSDEKHKRRVHFVAPNILTAGKPKYLIIQINSLIKEGKLENGMLIEEKEKTEFDRINIEILVHLTQDSNMFGHVDIAVGDTVYSYGTYDETKLKLGGFIAQGTMIVVPKMPYLKYSLDCRKKYVVGFGVCMSEQQLATVRSRIEETLAGSEKLETEYERAVREGRDGSEYTDSASDVVRNCGGDVYTVNKGRFRSYFGINTNCVGFADWLLSESGIDAISFSSLRTPGAYYNMLDNMFRRSNTRVVRKIWYIKSEDIKHIEKLSGHSEEAGEPES